jgi:ribosome biogenesis GTPase
MTGVVYKSTGSWYHVKDADGKLIPCRIKGKFRIEGITSTNPVAVGDVVEVVLKETQDGQEGVITDIQARKNYIVRKSVNLSKQIHIIAANIDAAFLLVTINNPPTYPAFIDRFLATAEAYEIDTVLLFNKEDSYTTAETEQMHSLMKLYQRIGYTCLEISALHKKNLEKVKTMMQDKTCMLSGHSGVGKSTLVNALAPGLNIKTADISAQHQQGQHTTTFAEMHDLDFGARIIDTPGIRGFGVVHMEKEEMGDYFREFFSMKDACKFNNCLHLEEPKCAIKAALETGEIAASRYKSYVQMIEGDEQHYRTDFWDS